MHEILKSRILELLWIPLWEYAWSIALKSYIIRKYLKFFIYACMIEDLISCHRNLEKLNEAVTATQLDMCVALDSRSTYLDLSIGLNIGILAAI